jgi:hypothetical protein
MLLRNVTFKFFLCRVMKNPDFNAKIQPRQITMVDSSIPVCPQLFYSQLFNIKD